VKIQFYLMIDGNPSECNFFTSRNWPLEVPEHNWKITFIERGAPPTDHEECLVEGHVKLVEQSDERCANVWMDMGNFAELFQNGHTVINWKSIAK
jgi:hypothetical protein